jgi:glyoxylase-like metal-dependent hydrolase (beta-lactamase superfamily II)
MTLIHEIQIGQLHCDIISEASTTRDLFGLFTSVPPDALTEAVGGLGIDPAQAPWAMNILAIRAGDETILVDTGMGAGDLPGKLASVGIAREGVTLVIITHAHGDHVNGLTQPGSADPAYPNARYVMHPVEWGRWTSDAFLNALPPADADATRARQSVMRERLVLVEDGAAIIPGVTAMLTPGHTSGHLALWLESDGAALLHIVDAAHHPVQLLHPDWSPKFDANPTEAVASRQRLFALAADRDVPVLAYHFAFPGLGRVRRADQGFHWHAEG